MDEPVLQAWDLHKAYRRQRVLQGVSFAVAPGTLVGIVGENGAGKSTLLRILAGELCPDRGTVRCDGALGYCPQAVVLNDTLTVAQHLDYFRAAYNSDDPPWADELLATLGYARYRATRVGTLSGGTKQKLNLTLALLHHPRVLLLDEPYQGFDWETYLRFWKLGATLCAQGSAVVIISHLLFEQARFDRIYRLADGQLQEQEPTAA